MNTTDKSDSKNRTNETAQQREPQIKGFVTKSELASQVRRKTRTIDNWMRQGLLPYVKLGRTILFDWEKVKEHIERNFTVRPR